MRTIVTTEKAKFTRETTIKPRELYRIYLSITRIYTPFYMFKYILKTFFELLMTKIIEEKYVFKMPFGLGFLRFMEYKVKFNTHSDGSIALEKTRYYIDIEKTRKKKKEDPYFYGFIYDTSLRVKYRISWLRGRIKNIHLFYLKPNRVHRKALYEKALEFSKI